MERSTVDSSASNLVRWVELEFPSLQETAAAIRLLQMALTMSVFRGVYLVESMEQPLTQIVDCLDVSIHSESRRGIEGVKQSLGPSVSRLELCSYLPSDRQ